MDFLAVGHADHIISKAKWNVGYDGSTNAVLMRGGGDFRHLVPVRDKSGVATRNAFVELYGPDNPRRFGSDGSGEIAWAAAELQFRGHRTSAPGEWQSNGVIEADVGLVKGGTAAALANFGIR